MYFGADTNIHFVSEPVQSSFPDVIHISKFDHCICLFSNMMDDSARAWLMVLALSPCLFHAVFFLSLFLFDGTHVVASH